MATKGYDISKAREQAYESLPTLPDKREAAAVLATEHYSQQTSVNVAKFSFAYTDLTDGSTVEIDAANILEDSQLPADIIVTKAYINVTTAFTGDGDGSSTISIGVDSATDLQSATAISGAPYSTTGIKALLDGAAGNMIEVSSAKKLSVALSIQSTDTVLETGAAEVYVEFVTATP